MLGSRAEGSSHTRRFPQVESEITRGHSAVDWTGQSGKPRNCRYCFTHSFVFRSMLGLKMFGYPCNLGDGRRPPPISLVFRRLVAAVCRQTSQATVSQACEILTSGCHVAHTFSMRMLGFTILNKGLVQPVCLAVWRLLMSQL
jgi:hypothetical protein